jgi:hypothetical protein
LCSERPPLAPLVKVGTKGGCRYTISENALAATAIRKKLIGQLKSGARALQMPVDNLVSNWAYLVMASLAWTLKAWFALSLPECGRWRKKYKPEKEKVLRMEFHTFRNAFMNIPTQVIRTGRRIVYRVLAWNPWLEVFLRGVDAISRQGNRPLRC